MFTSSKATYSSGTVQDSHLIPILIACAANQSLFWGQSYKKSIAEQNKLVLFLLRCKNFATFVAKCRK